MERLTDWLLEQHVERSDHIVAFGGGVVGDITGFAAHIVKRGCAFVQIPTTLLAQVDSSVGGKTAINSAAGKNMVGAFHQPALVLIDPDLLSTLPTRQLAAGFAEVVKYGLIDDLEFFDYCDAHLERFFAGDADVRAQAIIRSVQSKARIVAADETERTGTRALLNLGHTFGHALEADTGFSDRLFHGEAVAAGLDVDRTGDAPVAYRVDGALVGVAGLGERPLGGVGDPYRHLLTQHPRPLEVAGGGFDLPRRLQRRDLGLGAHVVHGEEGDVCAVGRAGRQAAGHAVEDEAAAGDVPGAAGTAGGAGQLRDPRLGLLLYKKNSLARWCQARDKFNKVHAIVPSLGCTMRARRSPPGGRVIFRTSS